MARAPPGAEIPLRNDLFSAGNMVQSTAGCQLEKSGASPMRCTFVPRRQNTLGPAFRDVSRLEAYGWHMAYWTLRSQKYLVYSLSHPGGRDQHLLATYFEKNA